MKIRITKKGLPKHQTKGQVDLFQPIGPSFTPSNAYTQSVWNLPSQGAVAAPVYNGQQMFVQSAVGEPTKTNPNIVPIKQFSKNEWINANNSKIAYGLNKGLQQFQNFMNTKPAKAVTNTATGIMAGVDVILPFAQMLDNSKKNKDIERAYRQSLVSQGPVDYRENRGDYEINTGMVDPYNTGAKSKGQFANAYYPPMMQNGGLTLGPIPFGDAPVIRNVYERTSPIMTPPVADNTYVRKPVVAPAPVPQGDSSKFKQWIAQRESSNNYKATNKVSSTAGKYQFLWNTHKKDISRLTGVKTKEEFLNNPDAQEAYFDYWDTTVLTPNAMRIKQQLGVPDSIEQIKARIHFAGPGGAYEYYATGKETTDAFGTTTSSYVRQDGGETFNPMKIRIVKTPTTEMEYGGQLGYGFDLGGRRVYTDMPESMSETVSDTIGPVPEEMATIEAEKGETILSDVDGDGMKEHMKIGGKRHSEGGTPLAADAGDFVFSDTKKMKIKNPEILKLFGKGGKSGGYTPAAIAKQYDMNKYKAILQDPNSDPMSKRTAEMMLSNYEKKLGMLALVQEAQKGFPSGIPSIAESVLPEARFGGYLEQYQTAGQVTPDKKSKIEFEQALKSGQFKKVGDRFAERTWREKVKDATPGQEAQYEIRQSKAPGKGSDAFNKAFGQARQAGLKEFTFNGKRYNTGIYTPGQGQKVMIKEAVPGTPEVWEDKKQQITYDDITRPDVPGVTTTDGNIPYDWTQQDRNNLMLAALKRGRIQKFSSVRPDVNPVMSDFRNMDWRGKAAELQGTYNSQMNTLGTYQSPTSLAANASFMAGQQAENLINRAIEPTEQQNVQIYNQVAAQNAGIMNQALANNAQNTFLRSQDRAVLNQQYINALNNADTALTQAVNQGITNASGIYNTNLVESPYYYYDPRFQQMRFNSPQAKAEFENSIKNAGPNDNDMMGRYLATRKELAPYFKDSKDLHEAVMDMMGMGKGSNTGRMSTTNYPFNQRMNRTTVQQPFPGYTNPMLMAQQQQQ